MPNLPWGMFWIEIQSNITVWGLAKQSEQQPMLLNKLSHSSNPFQCSKIFPKQSQLAGERGEGGGGGGELTRKVQTMNLKI